MVIYIIYGLIFIFAVLGIILMLQSLGIFEKFENKCKSTYKYEKEFNTIDLQLKILNGDFSESTKSIAFLSLIDESYVLIQKQGNSGNNYDDNAQTRKFDSLLSTSAIENLNSLEGQNGQYTF